MSIEVTIPFTAKVTVYFDVEVGTIITREMIDAKLNELQSVMDNHAFQSDSASLYVQLFDPEEDSFGACALDLYDSKTGLAGAISLGDAALIQP